MLRLERERERRLLSRSALARLANMHPATVGQIESGYIGKPYPVQLAKLAAALEWQGEPADLLEPVES
jgi:transcriptional regulator with XRE-family HTH domain